jgi:hypothetical protein
MSHGFVLLKSSYIEVLGGRVPPLVEKWELNRVWWRQILMYHILFISYMFYYEKLAYNSVGLFFIWSENNFEDMYIFPTIKNRYMIVQTIVIHGN